MREAQRRECRRAGEEIPKKRLDENITKQKGNNQNKPGGNAIYKNGGGGTYLTRVMYPQGYQWTGLTSWLGVMGAAKVHVAGKKDNQGEGEGGQVRNTSNLKMKKKKVTAYSLGGGRTFYQNSFEKTGKSHTHTK